MLLVMNEKITIRPVTGQQDLNRFIRYPWKIYRGNPRFDNWVPPLIISEKALLNIKKHPFYKHAVMQSFLAYDGKDPVGRISAIIDQQYLEYKAPGTGYFGFFESVDSETVARALFEAAEEWLRERGMEKMIGPISPTPNHILGLLINSFDTPPVIQTPYNPPYYEGLIEKLGFTKEEDHYAYYIGEEKKFIDQVCRVAKIAKKRGKFSVRPMNMKKFKDEVEIVRDIWNDAWQDNSDFVPWTEDEFDFMAEDLRMIVIPSMVLLAFVGDEPAGICISLPNLNEILIKLNGRLLPFGLFRLMAGKKKVKLFRFAIMGIKPRFQKMGIDAALINETHMRSQDLGMKTVELSLILEKNYKLRNMLFKNGQKFFPKRNGLNFVL